MQRERILVIVIVAILAFAQANEPTTFTAIERPILTGVLDINNVRVNLEMIDDKKNSQHSTETTTGNPGQSNLDSKTVIKTSHDDKDQRKTYLSHGMKLQIANESMVDRKTTVRTNYKVQDEVKLEQTKDDVGTFEKPTTKLWLSEVKQNQNANFQNIESKEFLIDSQSEIMNSNEKGIRNNTELGIQNKSEIGKQKHSFVPIDMNEGQEHAKHSVNNFTGKLLAEEDGGIISEIEQKFRMDELPTKTFEHGNLARLDAAIAKIFAAAAAKEGLSFSTTTARAKHRFLRALNQINYTQKQWNEENTPSTTTLSHTEGNNNNKNNENVIPNSKNKQNNTNTKVVAKQYAVLVNPKLKTFRGSKDLTLPPYPPRTSVATTTITTTLSMLRTVIENGQSSAHGEVVSAEISASKNDKNDASLQRVKWGLKAIFPVTNNENNGSVSTPVVTNNNKDKETSTAFKTIKATNTTLSKGTPAATTTAKIASITNSVKAGALMTATKATTTGAQLKTSAEGKVKTTTTTQMTKNTKTIESRIQKVEKALPTITENKVSTMKTMNTTKTRVEAPSTLMTTTISSALLSPHRANNPTESTLKPISRPRTLSQLQLKINALDCEIANIQSNAHIWRGNQTHELFLPIKSNNCQKEYATDCYAANTTSWDGDAEIQSGDILIVEINDALLSSRDKGNISSSHNTQVYQVTRSGHEHCDITEGILLDITPLVVDGRKLVTLYDKDLTEGLNLLIVVSELWGSKCIRLKVTTKTDNCGENADCSGKGICYSRPAMEEYECQCCTGFTGTHCEEIDACTPSPCTNNGICVDLSQGHEDNSYQCLCPYGYTGKNCQYESDPCNPAECLNGGTCVGNTTHFRCDCTAGYTGPLCQHSLNECESSPCLHGICVDQIDGFRCFCQPGFAGELCNFEYNECESNPCHNNGKCIDHIGSYECHCTVGFTGDRCQTKVDFCANKVCPEGHRCNTLGNEFSCNCPEGTNDPNCNQIFRAQCNVNPCNNGGTCWSSGSSFYCACRPGYTGTMCEDEFVIETVVRSSDFMVDDTSTNAKNMNERTFGSFVALKSTSELNNAYFAAGVLATTFFIVAIVVTICHCKVNQSYRKFSTRSASFFPIVGFGRRHLPKTKLTKHWLIGKGAGSSENIIRSNSNLPGSQTQTHLNITQTSQIDGRMQKPPLKRHLAMNLENDMYYTVDFSQQSQQSPLIQ